MIVTRGALPERNFTIIENCVLRDMRLSFRARGVLAYVLSFPNGVKIASDRLCEAGKEGRDAIRASFKELELAGYLQREKRQGANGQWETEIIIYDLPFGKPATDFQSSVNQSSENQPSVFQALNTEDLIQKTNTNKSVAAPVALAPTKPAAMTASRSSKPKDDFLLPNWIDTSHWLAWRSHPKLKNATAAQKQIAVEKLAKWREAGEDFAGALENAAASGYQGLFLPDNRTGANRSSETVYQRSQREKYEQIAPRIAAKNPNAARVVPVNPTTFFENLAKQQLEHKHA